MSKSAIARLNDFGQSPWYDNLARPLLTGGGLAKLVEVDGIRGVTSNPTILDKAIGAGEGYDEALAKCAKDGLSIEDTYWAVVIDDIQAATEVLRPVYDAQHGGDDAGGDSGDGRVHEPRAGSWKGRHEGGGHLGARLRDVRTDDRSSRV